MGRLISLHQDLSSIEKEMEFSPSSSLSRNSKYGFRSGLFSTDNA
jgi:hypothetical protein